MHTFKRSNVRFTNLHEPSRMEGRKRWCHLNFARTSARPVIRYLRNSFPETPSWTEPGRTAAWEGLCGIARSAAVRQPGRRLRPS